MTNGWGRLSFCQRCEIAYEDFTEWLFLCRQFEFKRSKQPRQAWVISAKLFLSFKSPSQWEATLRTCPYLSLFSLFGINYSSVLRVVSVCSGLRNSSFRLDAYYCILIVSIGYRSTFIVIRPSLYKNKFCGSNILWHANIIVAVMYLEFSQDVSVQWDQEFCCYHDVESVKMLMFCVV